MLLRKNLPLLALVVVVALVIGGYLGFTSLTKEKSPPAVGDVKVPPPKITGDDSSSNQQLNSQNGEKKVSPQIIEETNVPNADPKSGERIVWGEIKAVDVDKRILTIDQQMDDNSIEISPNVAVNKDAIIRTKAELISLIQVKAGDNVGIIITKERQARAVLVNY